MKSYLSSIFTVILLLGAANAFADSPIYSRSVERPMQPVYEALYASLEKRRLFVVFEPNIGATMARFAERWGEDYNRNALEEVRSMVFCNAWYTNQVSNADPNLLALCPLSVTLIHKTGRTTVLFERPSVVAKGSPAETVLREVEGEVVAAIEEALR